MLRQLLRTLIDVRLRSLVDSTTASLFPLVLCFAHILYFLHSSYIEYSGPRERPVRIKLGDET